MTCSFLHKKTLTELNPYLAPTTPLAPTFNQFNTALGVRSSLAYILNFDLRFIFDKIENFCYFERLPYDSQYEKSFIDPLSFITDNIGWRLDRSLGTQTSLEAFFG